jgi:two-component system NtrC family sensor kinase
VISFARGDHSLIKQKVSLVHFFNSFEEAARPEYETGNMSLEIELNGIKECWFDARRMLRVFTNISRNARQAMSAGGTFRITGTSTPSGGAEFLLSDNGPGVPEALRGKLFDLFTTDGKSDGSGLGLAIVKRIVEDHDGSIQFESIRGKGTTFRITLPAPNSTDGLTMQPTS